MILANMRITAMVTLCTVLLRLCLGMLFLTAGVSKWRRPRSIRHVIAQYQLLTQRGVHVLSRALGPVEIVAGSLLLLSLGLPALYWVAWFLATGLLLMFSAAIASVLLRGLEVPCGCGVFLNGHVATRYTLLRNGVLIGLLSLDGWLQSMTAL